MSDTPRSRRGFLVAVTALLGAIPLLGGLFTMLRAALAPARTDRPARLPVCRREQVPDDDVLVRSLSYQMRRGPAVESVASVVFVTRDPVSREVLALSGECTHLHCPVQKNPAWKRGSTLPPLACPCHGGKFARDGQVLDGPPPHPLRRLRLEVPADPKDMIHVIGS